MSDTRLRGISVRRGMPYLTQSAFGVTFTQESGAQVWGEPERGGIALHFARLGLEAVADAFERWTTPEANQQCYRVDKFKLFRRVFGIFNITNVATENPNAVAEVIAPNLVVYRNSATIQWVMTPNNLAHELGHKLDGRAGFGIKKLGSLQATLDDTSKGGGNSLHISYSRQGMAEGRDYLRKRAHEQGKISDGGDTATYSPLVVEGVSRLPISIDPEYAEFVPGRYLFFDVAQNRFSMWRSAVYTPWGGENARIDTLVINETADPTETAADAFLNWVRDGETNGYARNSFYDATDETNAALWRTFFNNNIGMFLRNAVIYGIGMVQFYQSTGLIPPSPIATSTNFATNYVLRLAPQELDATSFGSSSTLPTTVAIYGWLDANGILGDGVSTYWLLIANGLNLLLWIAAGGIAHDENQVKAQLEITDGTVAQLNPARDYSDVDIVTIIGV